MTKITIMLVGAAVMLFAGEASSHHSFAMFDKQKKVTLNGTVKEFEWANPHTWIVLDVKDAAGQPVEWRLEGGGPNGLARRGWTKNSVKPGDAATIVINPLKDGSPGGGLLQVSINGAPVGAGGVDD